MVISGTHALDIVMWMMEAKKPVELYARSVDKALGPICKGIDATAGMITFEDGSLYHASISWALPVVWPGAVYSLEVGITGTEGVLTIDDTHRDIVLATTKTSSRRAMRPIRSGAWTSSAAIRRATWRSASCAARCARRPSSG